MKKLITIFFCISMFSAVSAQDTIANPGFEHWETYSNSRMEDPIMWRSVNYLMSDSSGRGIHRSEDAYQGRYSLEIKPMLPEQGKDSSFTYVTIGVPLLKSSLNEIGLRSLGGLKFYHDGPFMILSGYYKLDLNSLAKDSVYARVWLKDISSQNPSTIIMASGKHVFQEAQSWTPFSIKTGPSPQWGSDGVADSLVVAFFYRSNNKDAGNTGRILIDDLGWEEATSITKNAQKSSLYLYPNPSKNGLFTVKGIGSQQTTYQIVDNKGSLIKTGVLNDDAVIDLQDSPSGIYTLQFYQGDRFWVETLVR